VVSQHVQLNKRGRRFFGLCPFHTEKTPSFTVNPDLQIFHCFGCDTGGDVFRFIQEIDRVSFPEAVTFLAARAGIQLQPDRDGGRGEVADKLYRANELAGKYYHYMLRQNCGAGALKYLRDRGLSDETIDRFLLGYAPPGWRDFLDVARPRGFDADVVEQGTASSSPSSTSRAAPSASARVPSVPTTSPNTSTLPRHLSITRAPSSTA